VLKNDGNVGIGTTNPTNGQLEVQGSSTGIYANSGYIGIQAIGNSYGIQATGGTYGYGVYAVGGTYGVWGSSEYNIGLYGQGPYGVYASGSSYDFYGASGSPSYFAGSVGIGEGNPAAGLTVNKSVIPQAIFKGHSRYGSDGGYAGEILLGDGTDNVTAALLSYNGGTSDSLYIAAGYDTPSTAWGNIYFKTRLFGTSTIDAMSIQGLTGNVGIGTDSPNVNAALDVSSTTKAFMPPRMTTAEKFAIPSPTAGMTRYPPKSLTLAQLPWNRPPTICSVFWRNTARRSQQARAILWRAGSRAWFTAPALSSQARPP
jgi:hypothetical protein